MLRRLRRCVRARALVHVHGTYLCIYTSLHSTIFHLHISSIELAILHNLLRDLQVYTQFYLSE